MTSNREERNRFLGFPVGPDPHREHREEQHLMGIPADVFDDVNLDALRSLAHPVRAYRRWARRRRLSPYAADEDERM
jgi:hypothetical protein